MWGILTLVAVIVTPPLYFFAGWNGHKIRALRKAAKPRQIDGEDVQVTVVLDMVTPGKAFMNVMIDQGLQVDPQYVAEVAARILMGAAQSDFAVHPGEVVQVVLDSEPAQTGQYL